VGDLDQAESGSKASRDEGVTIAVGGPAVGGATSRAGASGAEVGSRVGRYVVLDEIGRGGMGRVLRAYDPKLQREVALKLVHHGGLGREATVRLVAEARAMAKLSHPNVVSVYDVEELGTGDVVVVMEFVPGTTLQEWLQAEPRRRWLDVIRVFEAAGRGLAAAHAAGLLHRDFKPANVLLARDGQVLVADFGLAKRTGVEEDTSERAGCTDPSTDPSLTQDGMVLGTPRYMAPEQHHGVSVGPPADQYALCVSLWEALCGDPPFSGEDVLPAKLGGPPSWPAAASTVPKPIVEAIRRGLEPSVDRRWPDIESLLAALAHDPGRRRRRRTAFAGGLGLLTLGGLGWYAWATDRAQRCAGASDHLAGLWNDGRRNDMQRAFMELDARHAADAWARTRTSLDAYADTWVEMHTEACEATTLRGEQSTEALDLRMACLYRARIEFAAAIEVLVTADADAVLRAHEVTGGLPPLERCGDVAALRADVEPPPPEDAPAVEVARTLLAEAKALREAGRVSDARLRVDDAQARLVDVGYEPVQSEVSLTLAAILEHMGQYQRSEAAYIEALERAARWRQWEIMRTAATQLVYVVGYHQRRMDDALRYHPLARGLARADRLAEARVHNVLGIVLKAQGKYAEAELEHRQALELRENELGPGHPDTASSRNNLANLLYLQGKYPEAELEHRQALAVLETALGVDHPRAATSLDNLANALAAQGKLLEAESAHRRALEVRESVYGLDHPQVAQSRNNLALVLFGLGRYVESETEHRRVLSFREATLGTEHPLVASSRNNLAIVLHARGAHEEAEVEHRRALAIREATLGPEHPDVALSRHNLANLLFTLGRPAEAEAEHRRALAIREAVLPPDHPDLAQSRSNLAAVLIGRKTQEAVELAEAAWARRQRDDIPEEHRADTAFVLARALWRSSTQEGIRGRAEALALQALGLYEGRESSSTAEVETLRAWLTDSALR
jgi:eukaryotic-like serine/threonine-protein kinase